MIIVSLWTSSVVAIPNPGRTIWPAALSHRDFPAAILFHAALTCVISVLIRNRLYAAKAKSVRASTAFLPRTFTCLKPAVCLNQQKISSMRLRTLLERSFLSDESKRIYKVQVADRISALRHSHRRAGDRRGV